MKNFVSVVQSVTKLILTLLLTLCAVGLYAQLGTLSVQGVLTKADGTAVEDGTYTIEFSLWKNETSGNTADRVHVENITTQTTGGVYSVILGLATPFGSGATFAEVYYLGIKYGATELLPRPRLTSAPYALALLGSTNVFPGTGMVTCDAITVAGSVNIGSATASGALGANHFVAAGGAPGAGVAGKGYSFNGIGDADGGLFSLGDNNIALYANATKVLESSNTNMNIPISLQVGGNESVTGTFSAGVVFSESNVIAKGASNNGGFTFQDDPGYDTGLFSNGPGECQLRTNGTSRIWLGNNLDISNNNNVNMSAANTVGLYGGGSAGNSTNLFVGGAIVMNVGTANSSNGQLYIENLKPKTGGGTFRTIQINPANWVVQYDNSSRRYKYNIKPLEDDFSLILKAQPRIYTRQPNEEFTEVGYIAEEMDSIGLQHLVQRNPDGVVDGFDYTKMILYAVEVLKTQHADIEKLKAEVAALTAEKNTLRTENNSLRATNAALQTNQTEFSAQLNALSKRMQAMEAVTGNR
jgi:FtsZ-binding cell division protein ZapB